MMSKLNVIRNKANAMNAINLIEESNQSANITMDQMIRFSYHDIMNNLNLSKNTFSDLHTKRFDHLTSSTDTNGDINKMLLTDLPLKLNLIAQL